MHYVRVGSEKTALAWLAKLSVQVPKDLLQTQYSLMEQLREAHAKWEKDVFN